MSIQIVALRDLAPALKEYDLAHGRTPNIVTQFLTTKSLFRVPVVISVLGLGCVLLSTFLGIIALLLGIALGSSIFAAISAVCLIAVAVFAPLVFLGMFWLLIAMLIYMVRDFS